MRLNRDDRPDRVDHDRSVIGDVDTLVTIRLALRPRFDASVRRPASCRPAKEESP